MNDRRRSWGRRISAAVVLSMTAATVVQDVPAKASHGPFPVSTGIYRIPYIDGTQVTVSRDNHSHAPVRDRLDLVAGIGTPVVAAASGIIRAIVDVHGNSPNAGDGADINGNSGALLRDGVTPHQDAFEHSCNDATEDANNNNTLDPGEDLDGDGQISNIPNSAVIGLCQWYNNYVWIEHPNGEWTKYTHFGTGTVTLPFPNGFGWAVNDPIQAGQVLGLERDVGSAGGSHLHHEVAAQNGGGPLEFTANGGFITDGTNLVPFVCDIQGATPNFYFDADADADGNDDDGVADSPYTANPCNHQPPTADAGGPYVVNEGSAIALDGSGSSDPEGNILTYLWAPDFMVNDTSLAMPTHIGVEGPDVENVSLTVYDQIEALSDVDSTTVTIINVAPTVDVDLPSAIEEGGEATVFATWSDPGFFDTHTATIDWGDGSLPEYVEPADLDEGTGHVYGDNGIYNVTVTVTDDDGDSGSDTVFMFVSNVDPEVTVDDDDAVAFPDGDFLVAVVGAAVQAEAFGGDAGSDDLNFDWNTGDETTYFNNGIGIDPFPSSSGFFPFAAIDSTETSFASPGVEPIVVHLTDDDAGTDNDYIEVIVTGTLDETKGRGWWKHQYGNGNTQIDSKTAQAFLNIVNTVSNVFSEAVTLQNADDANAVLSPNPATSRARTTAELLTAWLAFASGAVAWDATVPFNDGTTMPYLDLMSAAEDAILDPATSAATFLDLEQKLSRVRFAS